MSTNPARKWDNTSQASTPIKKKQVTVKIHRQGWITRGEKMLYSLICLGLIIAGAYIVSYSSSIDNLNRELQTLEQTVQNQTAENRNLSFEINELSDPARITKIARDNGLKVQYAEVKRAESFNNN